MLDLIKNWWRERQESDRTAASDEMPVVIPKRRRDDQPQAPLSKTSAHVRKGSDLRPTRQTESSGEANRDYSNRIESRGPGKNVLVRNRPPRDDHDADEPLSILEDSEQSNDGSGIDPYNTGGFDRSKNWDNRFRK